ncbi:MAG: hypothetical protein IJH36_03070 [Clostridia bacterium]|nr:hypothetical protein [Clostridia bacterium]MBQ3462083.1 hypothetical protein [Clostridia bacterium]MBQ3471478.1 hypothetical protein [Clostridia bacterium]MBQ9599409.1 hypothetical protein [Clostridia bacterium]MBR0471003.1 hypothetical protein [Clostridia bacterium]
MAVTLLKACYRQGTQCGKNAVGNMSNSLIYKGTQAGQDSIMFSLLSEWKRLNVYGHGVTAQKMYCQQSELPEPNAARAVNHFIKLSGIDRVTMEYIASRSGNAVYSMNLGLRGGASTTASVRSDTQTVILRGHEGIFYALCLDSLMTQAAEYAAAAEYEYNPQWTTAAEWDFLMLSKTNTGMNITGASNIRLAQRGIVDLVAQHTAQGGDIPTITWYQMLYYCINTTSKTNRVTEYADAATAQTWCEENAPAAVAKYF